MKCFFLPKNMVNQNLELQFTIERELSMILDEIYMFDFKTQTKPEKLFILETNFIFQIGFRLH